MIFGYINPFNQEALPQSDLLKNLLLWDDAVFLKKKEASFFGSCIIPQKLKPEYKKVFFFHPESRWLIMFSGIIYDYENTKKEKKPDPTSLNKPEFLLNLFIKNGVKFANSLNGDFVLLFYNSSTNKTLIFRDHLGIRPISYSINKGVLWFCSDTINLSRVLYPKEKIQTEYLLSDFKFTDQLLTPSNKVHRILPGHYLKFDGEKASQEKYWFPEKINKETYKDYNSFLTNAQTIINTAVKIRCNKNAFTAVHFSGGLDSSTVAALVRNQYPEQEPFYGFSWSPSFELQDEKLPKDHSDERRLIEKGCKKIGASPIYNTITTKEYIKYANNPYQYSPYFHEQKVLERAYQLGVDVLFSGYGGDEFISCGTYGVFIDFFRGLKWKKLFHLVKNWPLKIIAKWLLFDILPSFLGVLSYKVLRQNRNTTRYLKREYKKNHRRSQQLFFIHRSRKQMHLGMLYHYHIPRRTEEWYLRGLKKGVEYRYPLLDKRIVEFIIGAPSDLMYQENMGRVILRDITKGLLPDELRNNFLKIDPAFQTYVTKLCADFFHRVYPLVEEMKKNPDLNFFNFDKFDEDYKRTQIKENKNLFASLTSNFIYLKIMHEFSQQYYI